MKLPFFHAKMLALIRLNNYLWRTIILKNGQQSKKTMEDVMQFLLVAGIRAFGIFRQFNKEKNKKSEKGNSMPAPEYEYEPEFEEPVIIEKTYEQVTASPKPPVFQEGTRNTYAPPSPPKTNKKAETCKNDFSIRSAEEARRAIIWSEILRRKY